jgi:Pyruvate/2-oxoacid:ferredoxin oxidoreductase delta subunit
MSPLTGNVSIDWRAIVEPRWQQTEQQTAEQSLTGNVSIDWRAIVEPRWQQTEQQTAEQCLVLCPQDTTELDFDGQQACGLVGLSNDRAARYVRPPRPTR